MTGYYVHESWEEPPTEPADGRYVYAVVHDSEGFIKEHRSYGAAQRHADHLNRQKVPA